MDPRLQPGFLGTGASLMADLSLLAYILLIVPAMLLGFRFARRNLHRPHHKYAMIAVTLVNWGLIGFLMLPTYGGDIAQNILTQPGNSRYLLPTIHGVLGLAGQGLATFVVVRMLVEDWQVGQARKRGERNLRKYWFRQAKVTMWLTLGLWLATSVLGVGTYLVRYEVIPVGATGGAAPPLATEEAPPAATEDVGPAPTQASGAAEQAPLATEEAEPDPDVAAPASTEEVPPPQ